MNDTEINQKLHEAMGLCWHDYQVHQSSAFKVKLRCSKCADTRYRSNVVNPPNYTGSLDAVSVAEQFVIEKTGHEYWRRIAETIQSKTGEPHPWLDAIAVADAKTRAEACLRALDLWDDETTESARADFEAIQKEQSTNR